VLGSRLVTTYVDRGREYNVILQGREDMRATSTDLTNIRVRSSTTKELIPLGSVVKLEETSGTMRLSRFNRLRAIKVTAAVAPGYSMDQAVDWFRQTVAAELPREATLMFDGESGEFTRTGQQLFFTFLLALAVVYLVLAAQFESFVHPVIIMVTVPLALLGAMVYEDARWTLRPGEGWQDAAAQVRGATCTVFVPSGARTMYVFFEPQIRSCDENTLTTAETVALALSPDQYDSEYDAARQKLNQAGFHKVADARTANPRIELYRH
jgi:hypothetical protein